MKAQLTHADFFSGIGGISLACERAGMQTVSFSEVKHFPSRLLARRWPGVPNLGDVKEIEPGRVEEAEKIQAEKQTAPSPRPDMEPGGDAEEEEEGE